MVHTKFKLILKAFSAKPSPLLVPILNNYNINISSFCSQYNEKTKVFFGLEIPVIITVISVSKFQLNLRTPSLFFLLNLFSEEKDLKLSYIKKILMIKKKEFYPLSNNKYLKMLKGTLNSVKIRIIL